MPNADLDASLHLWPELNANQPSSGLLLGNGASRARWRPFTWGFRIRFIWATSMPGATGGMPGTMSKACGACCNATSLMITCWRQVKPGRYARSWRRPLPKWAAASSGAVKASTRSAAMLRPGETCEVGCPAGFSVPASEVECTLNGDAVVCTCDGGDCAKLRTMCADGDEVKCTAYAFANGITTSPLQPSCSDGITLTATTTCHINCEPVD